MIPYCPGGPMSCQFVPGHDALSCWKEPSVDGYTVIIKGWTWPATVLR
ncbi:unnamed protein product [Staurois parvus]|uniref:Uncharacterized protein n=1 Tax=Staurois parvus TaxID=386267 RepID=A0ABN9FZD1_9NEOB|nr:unnamed protein product [Staurois parvus]